MSHKHVWILGFALAMFWMGCAASTPPPGAVAMTCTAATFRGFSEGSRGGQTGRYQCTMAKGLDGKEVPVRVIDSQVGSKLDCREKEGKITCPSVPLAMFTRATPPGWPILLQAFPPYEGLP